MIRDAGLAALQSRKLDEAVPLLEEACRLAPDDFNAVQYLSAAYQQAGRYLDAVNTQIAAVNLQPANPQARYNLGVIMRSGGYLNEARQAFEQALQLQPAYPQATEALKVLDGSAPLPSAPPPGADEEPAAVDEHEPRQYAAPAQYAPPDQFAAPAQYDTPGTGYEPAPINPQTGDSEPAPEQTTWSPPRRSMLLDPDQEEETADEGAAPPGFYQFGTSEPTPLEHASPGSSSSGNAPRHRRLSPS